jgi:glutamine cyclotransferase
MRSLEHRHELAQARREHDMRRHRPFIPSYLAPALLLLVLAALAVVPAASTASAGPPAPVAGYRVIRAYPHDPNAFTQGLVYEHGFLYEGTGRQGQSSLRKVELETGTVVQSVSLDLRHFGEGIAIVDNRIYQLTWQTRTCFVYNKRTFTVLETFSYDGEGWGLTTDGQRLIMSNGTSTLAVRDPQTFAIVREIEVQDHGVAVERLNELEYIDGEVWANVWQTDRIARINPLTGEVTGWIDLTGLLAPADREGRQVDVLNGIAYDAAAKRIFVTGKLWPKLYQIEIVPSETPPATPGSA